MDSITRFRQSAAQIERDVRLSELTDEEVGMLVGSPEAWRPIETAPKDAWARSRQILCGHAEKKWIRMGRHYGEIGRWYYSGTNERSQWAETPGDAPTHWRPLPAPPEAFAALKGGADG